MIHLNGNLSKDKELETLREAWSALNDVARTIARAQSCIGLQNIGMAKDYLKAAEWHTEQANKAIKEVGETKKGRR